MPKTKLYLDDETLGIIVRALHRYAEHTLTPSNQAAAALHIADELTNPPAANQVPENGQWCGRDNDLQHSYQAFYPHDGIAKLFCQGCGKLVDL